MILQGFISSIKVKTIRVVFKGRSSCHRGETRRFFFTTPPANAEALRAKWALMAPRGALPPPRNFFARTAGAKHVKCVMEKTAPNEGRKKRRNPVPARRFFAREPGAAVKGAAPGSRVNGTTGRWYRCRTRRVRRSHQSSPPRGRPRAPRGRRLRSP